MKTEQETIEAMEVAYKFGQHAGPIQDPMCLAYAVARAAVLEEAATAFESVKSYKSTMRAIAKDLRAMKGKKP